MGIILGIFSKTYEIQVTYSLQSPELFEEISKKISLHTITLICIKNKLLYFLC